MDLRPAEATKSHSAYSLGTVPSLSVRRRKVEANCPREYVSSPRLEGSRGYQHVRVEPAANGPMIQSLLPRNSCPICIFVYADRARLSSFGTAKAYPVMIALGNLPMELRNGVGVGGARTVGWLPIV